MSQANTLIGFLPVDKAGDMTSHDVVDLVRRATGIRKVGHAGTLDPMATGLLICGVGPATRLMRYVQDLPKTYLADAKFGVSTDTLDATGAVLHEDEVRVDKAQVDGVIPDFVGGIDQVPPMVSAVKVGGERLYEKARRGEVVEREPRPVAIHSLELVDITPGIRATASFRIECGRGTYVRTLIDDLAQVLGTHAHLTSLRRTRIGSFSVENAVAITLDGWEDHLITPAGGLGHLPCIVVDEDSPVHHGGPIPKETTGVAREGKPLAVLDEEGTLLAVYRGASIDKYRPEVVLPQ
ncbi:MAG: tRNA pseudouridine(55) synthase TruB [Acidimicrobiia bacterium]|nr:tRNA pseudouridine(55) synthase TruB [Acidimicrobiia bacterium]